MSRTLEPRTLEPSTVEPRTLEHRFESFARRADCPRGRKSIGTWAAVVQFAVTDGQPCHLAVANGAIAASAGWHPSPTVIITADSASLLSVLEAEIDATHLIARGDLTVAGDYYDMINLGRVALAVRPAAKAS